MIQLSEYLAEVNKRYEPYPQDRRDNVAALAPEVQAMLGLSTEVGEVQDLFLKSVMYNRQLDQTALIHELGDVFHYFMRILELNGISLHVVMEQNLAKLAKRDYFDGERV